MQSVLSSLEIHAPEISDASLVTKHAICCDGAPAWPWLLSLEARGAGTDGWAGIATGRPESLWVGRRRGPRGGQANVNCLRSAERVSSNPEKDIAKRLRSGDDSHEAVAVTAPQPLRNRLTCRLSRDQSITTHDHNVSGARRDYGPLPPEAALV